MLAGLPRQVVTVMGLEIPESDVDMAVNLANDCQSALTFHYDRGAIGRPTELARYRLDNGGYDFDRWLSARIRRGLRREGWLVVLTDLPYSELGRGDDPNGLFFFGCDDEERSAIVSTHLWAEGDSHEGRSRQRFLLFMLATFAFAALCDLNFHEETQGCVLDYCERFQDIQRAILADERLCTECEQLLERRLRGRVVTLDQAAAARRLLNRARGRRSAFIAMPFRAALERTNAAIHRTLTRLDWLVVRADEVPRPRTITDKVIMEIIAADLVVADLTWRNPNVFYEIGFAHASGTDVVLATQHRDLPIDVQGEVAIKYNPTEAGYRLFAHQLARLAGPGRL